MDLDLADRNSAFLFYLKMPFGVRVSSGAGRCADSSQAFSLY